MVLSYVTMGAVLAPTLHLDRLLLTLIAYFLGLGVSAHALNELHGRHWGNALTALELKLLFIVPLIAALSIGAYGSLVLYESSQLTGSIILLILIFLETLFLLAYNTGFGRGKFHNDLAFAFSWAALPCIVSYFVNVLSLSAGIAIVATAAGATAAIEINLSRWCKEFRRRDSVSEVRFTDGSSEKMSTKVLIERPEKALQLIVVAVDLLGVGLLVWRLTAG